MLLRTLAAIGVGSGCLLAAGPAKQDEPKQKVEVSATQRIDFPAGGAHQTEEFVGVLTMEAWDRPDVEITTIKSTKGEYDAQDRDKETQKLERVNVSAERQGNESGNYNGLSPIQGVSSPFIR